MKNETKKTIAIYMGIIITLAIFGYLIYPIFPRSSFSGFPEGCQYNYPNNVTLDDQSIYNRFWSNKCCSISYYPNIKEFNVCWLKEDS